MDGADGYKYNSNPAYDAHFQRISSMSSTRYENDWERSVAVLQYEKRKRSDWDFPVFMKLIKSNTKL